MTEKKLNKEKRTPRVEPKLNIQLNEEQKQLVELFYEYDVVFCHGDFASGKTASAVHTALTYFNKRLCEKIWITRPMIKNNLAVLPGTLEEKLEPYVYPIKQNLEVCQGKEKTEKMLNNGIIKIMPIDVAKGVTFMESVVIVDEYQDMNYSDFRTILTRLGKDSKMIFCGSEQQIDSKIGKDSCIHKTKALKDSGLVGFVELKSNHRNKVLTEIIKFLES